MLPRRHWQARFIACNNKGGIGLSFKMNGLVLPMSARLRSIMMAAAAISLPAGPLLAQARPVRSGCPAGGSAHGAGPRQSGGCPAASRAAGGRAGPAAVAAGDVGRAQRPGPALLHPADRPRGTQSRRLRPGRADRGDAPAQSAGAVEGSDRPLQPGFVRPRARPRQERRARTVVRHRSRPRRGAAG